LGKNSASPGNSAEDRPMKKHLSKQFLGEACFGRVEEEEEKKRRKKKEDEREKERKKM
jgi:hypothetical protein